MLAPDTVVPPFAIMGGNPGTVRRLIFLGELCRLTRSMDVRADYRRTPRECRGHCAGPVYGLLSQFRPLPQVSSTGGAQEIGRAWNRLLIFDFYCVRGCSSFVQKTKSPQRMAVLRPRVLSVLPAHENNAAAHWSTRAGGAWLNTGELFVT